jgi:hypothetical protein
LSFAGEDREYAEKFANELKSCGIKVFYDRFKKEDIWGRDLLKYLQEMYRVRAKFCIIFCVPKLS